MDRRVVRIRSEMFSCMYEPTTAQRARALQKSAGATQASTEPGSALDTHRRIDHEPGRRLRSSPLTSPASCASQRSPIGGRSLVALELFREPSGFQRGPFRKPFWVSADLLGDRQQRVPLVPWCSRCRPPGHRFSPGDAGTGGVARGISLDQVKNMSGHLSP